MKQIRALVDDDAIGSYYCLVANNFGGVEEICSASPQGVREKVNIIQIIGRLILANSDDITNIFMNALEYIHDKHPEVFTKSGFAVHIIDPGDNGHVN